MSVDILMATYNGEKYLRNQLLSLQQQTYEDWTLWVRDDGSTDNTLQILEQFAESDSRIRIVLEESGRGLGAGKNFIGLTKFSSAQYAIFCDQDDIWFEKKLERLVSFAGENFLKNKPCLVMCDGYGYSDNLGMITSDRVWLWFAKSLREFLFFNAGYQGCNCLFNADLRDFLKTYKANYFYMHDDVASLVAHTFGEVFFIKDKLMLYRQHDHNVTGNIITSFGARVSNFFRGGHFVISRCHYEEKNAFFSAYSSQMNDADIRLFKEYLRFPGATLFGRLSILLKNSFSLGGKYLPLFLKTCLRRPLE